MESSMISISVASILSAEPAIREGILQLAGLTEIKARAPSGFGVLSTRHTPLELDEDEAAEFLETCSPKTQKVLREIIKLDGKINGAELERSLAIGPLRGVWTGLTRRARKLSGNDDANLFEWVWNEDTQSYDGTMAKETVEAFRALL